MLLKYPLFTMSFPSRRQSKDPRIACLRRNRFRREIRWCSCGRNTERLPEPVQVHHRCEQEVMYIKHYIRTHA